LAFGHTYLIKDNLITYSLRIYCTFVFNVKIVKVPTIESVKSIREVLIEKREGRKVILGSIEALQHQGSRRGFPQLLLKVKDKQKKVTQSGE